MKPVMRTKCVICDSSSFEPLYKLPSFPAFLGCVTYSEEKDLKMDMSWAICPKCGTIQLDTLVPLDILYQESHIGAVGLSPTWQAHHKQLSSLIIKYGGKNRLEIGGANGLLARLSRQKDKSGYWLILDPEPILESEPIPNTDFRKGWFDANFKPPFRVDTIIHSHAIEHLHEPSEAFGYMSKLLDVGNRMIFAAPNMEAMLKAKYGSCLDFEHTFYLPEDTIEFLLQRHNFKLLLKKYFKDYAIFFICEKTSALPKPNLRSNYRKNKALFNEFVQYHLKLVTEINPKIEKYKGPVYIFGAQVFTLYLFAFGLRKERFLNVLDNSPLKIDRRLYGTNLITRSPKCLREEKEALVVLHAGVYNEEIKKDILENINPNVMFC